MYLPSFYTIVLRLPMHILSPFLNSFAVGVFIPRISTALPIYVVRWLFSTAQNLVASLLIQKAKSKLLPIASKSTGPDPPFHHHAAVFMLICPLPASSSQRVLCSLFHFTQALLKGHLIREVLPILD